jgi:DNA-binding NarL/FixJ family response regulator
MPDSPIRVAVVDDHPSIALAVRAAIESEPSSAAAAVAFAGSGRNVADARALLAPESEHHVDVVLCDIQLESGLDGLEVVTLASKASAKAIVFTSFDRSSLMRAAFEQGAAGFLDKGSEPAEILAAIRAVARGGTAFSGAALDAARSAPRVPSEREIAVIGGLQRGATSAEIAARLGISARTVESHLRRMFDRYGVVSRTELAILAIEQGWIRP